MISATITTIDHRQKQMKKKKDRYLTKLNGHMAREIRLYRKTGLSLKAIAGLYRVSEATISRIVNGKIWRVEK